MCITSLKEWCNLWELVRTAALGKFPVGRSGFWAASAAVQSPQGRNISWMLSQAACARSPLTECSLVDGVITFWLQLMASPCPILRLSQWCLLGDSESELQGALEGIICTELEIGTKHRVTRVERAVHYRWLIYHGRSYVVITLFFITIGGQIKWSGPRHERPTPALCGKHIYLLSYQELQEKI